MPTVFHLQDLEGLPQQSFSSIPEPIEFPHQLISIEKADPTKIVRNGLSSLLTPTVSTVFVFDIPREFAGKMCSLNLFMPPAFWTLILPLSKPVLPVVLSCLASPTGCRTMVLLR